MKKGTQVKIIDGSYAVRVDKYRPFDDIDRTATYTVLESSGCYYLHSGVSGDTISDESRRCHDIFIQNNSDGKIYLHSANFVGELSPAQIYERYISGDQKIPTEAKSDFISTDKNVSSLENTLLNDIHTAKNVEERSLAVRTYLEFMREK